MSSVITFFRFIFRSLLLVLIISIGSLFTVFFQRGTMPTKGLCSFITKLFHQSITKALGIKIKYTGTPNQTNTFFVSNHITWLDILVIGQSISTHFLAMVELKSWPIVGWLASRAGTLYISRGSTIAASTAIQDISEVLNQDHNIVVFAEGKVTDGNIRKFHSRLFQSAIESQSFIQPIALRYPSDDNSLVNPTILFTDDTTLPQSLFKIMTTKQTNVEITFLKPLKVNTQTRNELANYAEQKIKQHLGQADTPS